MLEDRYDIREEANGTWTIYEVSTGLIAVLEDQLCCALSYEDADKLADYLNWKDMDEEGAA